MQLHPTPHQASRDGSGLYRIRRMHKPTTLQLSTKTGEMESHRIAAAADNDLYQDSYRATQGSSDSENETRTLLSEWYIPSLWPVQRTLDQPHLTGESLTTRLHDW
jgi:nitrate reductase beta subunit